jgi:DNA repair exonuclease SbcCD ATPase subunit
MKKSISILFCLFMFPLFLNTSQVNAQSSIPSCLSFQSGDHAARIECFQKNEKKFRARIIELRRKHNIEQVNYDSFGESCPSRSPGDHAARLECFKNNDNAYQAIINELMATKEGSAVDFNNEAKRFQESTTEGQHIQQQEAKVSDLERQISQLLKEKEADRTTIEGLYQGRDELSSLLQESRAKHLAGEQQLATAQTRIKEQQAQLEVDSTTKGGQKQEINDLSNLLQESRAKHLAAEQQLATAQTSIKVWEDKIIKIGHELVEANAKYRRAEQSIITNRKEVEGQQNRINTISSELNTCTSQIDICTAAKERRGVESLEYINKHEKIHAAKLASIRDYLYSLRSPVNSGGPQPCTSKSDGSYGYPLFEDQLKLPVFFPDPR